MKRQTAVRAGLTGLCVFCALFIFSNSLQTGPVSGARSVAAMEALQTAGIFLPEWLLRKAGHLAEFALYGFLLCAAMRSCGTNRRRAVWGALALSAATGAADEILQLFIPGRSGRLTDVCIDTFGAGLGILCCCLILHFLFDAKTPQHPL